MKNTYKENYKPVKKEITDGYRRFKALLCFCWWNQYCENSYIAKHNNSMLNGIPIKVPMTFITEMNVSHPKVHLEEQKTMNTHAILSKKEQCGDFTLPDFKLYFILQTVGIKTAWF
jgi:hypothetical protein